MIAYLHFLVTGTYVWLGWFFVVAGSLFFLVMTATECWLAFTCRSWFDADEPMRLAWGMIAFAALARLAGVVIREVADGRLPWGPVQLRPLFGGVFANLGQMGLFVGGPLSMAFLAIGLGRVLQTQRRFWLRGPLTLGDRVLLVLIIAFSVSQLVINLSLLGGHPSPGAVLLWLSDPLLALLLIEAVLVRRAVVRIGQGLLAKCWGMFVMAIVTTSLGDAAIWANNHDLLSKRLTALSWYIWFVAAAAFASAPAYQLAAISIVQEPNLRQPASR